MEYINRKEDISKKIDKKSRKTNKIISILKEFKDLSKCNVLDIGAGTGIIASNLSKHFKKVYGVDVVSYRVIKEGYIFKKIKDEKLPFKNKFFDVVISNQVIEHVNNQEKHLEEINRVLKKDGICYLSTPNKYWVTEPHYYLPFLGIMPKKLANFYLRIFKNKNYDVSLLSYNEVCNKANKYFKVINFTPKLVKNPNKYHLEKNLVIISSLTILPPNFLLKYIIPSFIFILKKK